MADTLSSGQNPFEAWSKLLESTMKGYSATQTTAGQTQAGGKDPWITFIDQLWEANPTSKVVPLAPGEIARAFQQVWLDALKNPDRTLASYNEYMQQYAQLMTNAALKFWGQGQDVKPVITEEKGDKRFSAPDWQENALFDTLKQSYLLAATTLLKTASQA